MKEYLALQKHRKKPRNRLEIPWLKQTDDYSCGAVAGWLAIKALYPTRRNKRAFYRDTNPSKKYGTSIHKLSKALRKHGVRVGCRKRKLEFNHIKEAIDAGFPVIACIRTKDPWLHWVTIYAYKEGGGGRKIYLANNGWDDPNGEISYRSFRRIDTGEYLVCSVA